MIEEENFQLFLTYIFIATVREGLLSRILIMLSALAMQACITSTNNLDRVGDKYQIFLERTSETSGDRSTGESNSRYALIETVIARRTNGIELEFDLPEDTPPEDRARNWKFPVRILKQKGRSYELLNEQQLHDRVQAWMEKWNITNEMCGRWVFTWTAIKLECDPASVINFLEPFDLRIRDLYDGALYREPYALEPARLNAEAGDSGRQTYIARMKINPDRIRRDRAEGALVVAEIMGEGPETLESALKAQADDQITGSITTTFETDDVGRVIRRVRLIKIETTFGEDAATKREIITETVIRTPLHNASGDRSALTTRQASSGAPCSAQRRFADPAPPRPAPR